jgi:formylmethanofuran--tetrahydromethanopterin N-formyltransferase
MRARAALDRPCTPEDRRVSALQIDGVAIEDTFAEAFGMRATRVIVTAEQRSWALHAATSATGFATSVIGCGCEAGIERELSRRETPDRRPGFAILIFAMSSQDLQKHLERRAGQCLMTCPTTAAYGGIPAEAAREWLGLGSRLRYFGDGFQISKRIAGKRYWRVPVMDGEFVCEEKVALVKGIGGGNSLILARDQAAALAAAERATAAMRKGENVILPFPGGVVRSGSKVGSKYKGLPASTNDAYCPTLAGLTLSRLPAGVGAVVEIVIDGLDANSIALAMRAGIRAACARGAERGVVAVTAGNYGGRLGPHHFHLKEVLA